MSTAVRPVRIGLDGALLGDGALTAMIGDRVYLDSNKPNEAPLPFLSYGTPYERDFAVFNGDGNFGTRLLHLYGDDEDVVEVMYEHVKRVCAAGISVDGHTLLILSATLLSIASDPSGAAHSVVRVAALTQAA